MGQDPVVEHAAIDVCTDKDRLLAEEETGVVGG